MKPITVKTEKDKFVISVDRSAVNESVLINLVDQLQMEYLAQKANIDPSVIDFGEELKQSWWDKNKDRILSSEE